MQRHSAASEDASCAVGADFFEHVLWLPRREGFMELIATSFGFLYAMLNDELALLHRRW